MAVSMTEYTDKIIQGYPIKVNFVGFSSDTYTLQRNGWQIAAEQRHSMSYAGLEIRLILKHEGAKQYAITDMLRVDHYSMLSNIKNYTQILTSSCFNIIGLSNSVNIRYETRGNNNNWFSNFEAVDCTPQLIKTTDYNLQDFKLFRPIPETAKEIIIDPNSVNELMNRVLELQNPKQKELRDKYRMERLREGIEAQSTTCLEESIKYNPARDIHLQIVTAA